ncbi:hypothetical protein ACX9MO_06225 [Pseudooceanicola sp. 502str34]
MTLFLEGRLKLAYTKQGERFRWRQTSHDLGNRHLGFDRVQVDRGEPVHAHHSHHILKAPAQDEMYDLDRWGVRLHRRFREIDHSSRNFLDRVRARAKSAKQSLDLLCINTFFLAAPGIRDLVDDRCQDPLGNELLCERTCAAKQLRQPRNRNDPADTLRNLATEGGVENVVAIEGRSVRNEPLCDEHVPERARVQAALAGESGVSMKATLSELLAKHRCARGHFHVFDDVVTKDPLDVPRILLGSGPRKPLIQAPEHGLGTKLAPLPACACVDVCESATDTFFTLGSDGETCGARTIPIVLGELVEVRLCAEQDCEQAWKTDPVAG